MKTNNNTLGVRVTNNKKKMAPNNKKIMTPNNEITWSDFTVGMLVIMAIVSTFSLGVKATTVPDLFKSSEAKYTYVHKNKSERTLVNVSKYFQ